MLHSRQLVRNFWIRSCICFQIREKLKQNWRRFRADKQSKMLQKCLCFILSFALFGFFIIIYLLLSLTVLTMEEHLMPRSFPLVALWRHCLPPFNLSKAIGCNSSLPTSHRRFMLYNMHTHAWPVQWVNWLPCHHDILQFLKKSCKGQRADSRRAGQSSSFSLVRVSVLIAIIAHSLMSCVV